MQNWGILLNTNLYIYSHYSRSYNIIKRWSCYSVFLLPSTSCWVEDDVKVEDSRGIGSRCVASIENELSVEDTNSSSSLPRFSRVSDSTTLIILRLPCSNTDALVWERGCPLLNSSRSKLNYRKEKRSSFWLYHKVYCGEQWAPCFETGDW